MSEPFIAHDWISPDSSYPRECRVCGLKEDDGRIGSQGQGVSCVGPRVAPRTPRVDMADGGPAFPTPTTIYSERKSNGMSMRQWYASMALCSGYATASAQGLSETDAAAEFYRMADAMLAEDRRGM